MASGVIIAQFQMVTVFLRLLIALSFACKQLQVITRITLNLPNHEELVIVGLPCSPLSYNYFNSC